MRKLVISEANGLTTVTEIVSGKTRTTSHACSLTDRLKAAVADGYSEASIVYHSFFTATVTSTVSKVEG